MREQADESGNQDLRASIDQYDAALQKLVPHESFDDYSGVKSPCAYAHGFLPF